MKNNALKLVGLALIVPMLTACPKPKKGPNWSKEVQDAMVTYIGEVLPYVELNQETLTYGYDDSWGGLGLYQFVIYDDNETNVLEGYDAKLVAAGFEYTEFEYESTVYISYDKTNDVGFVSVDYKYEEATADTAAGNTITVSIPQYVDEETLLADGYEKQTGFPTEVVEQTLEGSGITMDAINLQGEWFVASNLYVDEEDGSSYYCAYLVTKGDYFDAVAEDFEGQGLTYDEEYGCYYDAAQTTDAELYVSVVRGYTMIDLFGQTLNNGGNTTIDYTIQGDGLTQTSFGLTDGGTSYAEHTATGASGASYTAQCASAHGIQIRSKNNNSGIIGYNASKTAKSITIVFDAETGSSGNERKIDIYASNTAFTIADMYSGSMTSIGSITYSSSNLVQSYTFTSDYHYIGLRSNNGAIYMTVVDVVWSD